METTPILTLASALVATLFGLLACIIGWLGARIIMRLDLMVDRLDAVRVELHDKINGINLRLTKVETMVLFDDDK